MRQAIVSIKRAEQEKTRDNRFTLDKIRERDSICLMDLDSLIN